MKRRVTRISAAAGVAALMASVGAAWACTVAASVTVGPNNAPVGAKVVLEGTSFVPDGTVEVHLENPSTRVEFARASGERFSVTVAVPDVPAGMYTVVAIGRDASGTQQGKAVEAFEVLPSSSDNSSSGDPGGAVNSNPPAAPAPAEVSEPAPGGSAPAASSSDSAPAQGPQQPPRRGSPGDTGGGAGAGDPAAEVVPPAPPAAVPAVDNAAPATSSTPPAGAATLTPPLRSASADLWSGFASSTKRGRVGSSLMEQPATHTNGPGFGVGLGLLSLGLGGLGAGALAAVALRRRAHAAAGVTRPRP